MLIVTDCLLVWSEKLKIVLLILPCYQNLPFDMGFKEIEKFFKQFNDKICPKGAKVTKNRIFS